MILNLKRDTPKRFVLFEDLAKVLVKRERGNNFIFVTRLSGSLDVLIWKYDLDISGLENDLVDRLRKKFTSPDIIEFVVDENRKVKDLLFYEVKTKSNRNHRGYDMCVSSYDFYEEMQSRGFVCKLVSFVLFEDWRYSFNVHGLDLSKMRRYSRADGYCPKQLNI
ncbi:MAG: hypothetical protein ACQEP1_06245 [Nanobdellota archaeon]